MASIESVDYNKMANLAKQMRSQAQSLNTQISNAYKSADDMRTSWYGTRYNELAHVFNEVVPELNELLSLVVYEIPTTLEKVANNYSTADNGSNCTSVEETTHNAIATIDDTATDKGMKCLTDQVETVKTQVENNFSDALTNMSQITNFYNQLDWESEASQAFEQKFNSLKSSVTEAFGNIQTQFSQLMGQAVQDIQSAESSSNVNNS